MEGNSQKVLKYSHFFKYALFEPLHQVHKLNFFRFLFILGRHLWPSGSELKTGRREVPCSISGLACRPSRSKFSVDFSNTHVNTGQDPLERLTTEGISPTVSGPSSNNWTYSYNFFILTTNLWSFSHINVDECIFALK